MQKWKLSRNTCTLRTRFCTFFAPTCYAQSGAYRQNLSRRSSVGSLLRVRCVWSGREEGSRGASNPHPLPSKWLARAKGREGGGGGRVVELTEGKKYILYLASFSSSFFSPLSSSLRCFHSSSSFSLHLNSLLDMVLQGGQVDKSTLFYCTSHHPDMLI